MADIVGVREFLHNLSRYQNGDQVIVVNGSKRTIVASVEFKEPPAEIEKTVKHIYRK